MSNQGHHSHQHEYAAFAVGATLNLIFVAMELAFGFWANSLELLVDAGLNNYIQ